MDDDQEFVAWVGLSLVPRLGATLMRALLASFQTPTAVFQAESQTLLQVRGVGKQIAAQIQAVDLGETARQIARWQKAGIQLLRWDDDGYPSLLKRVDDAPPLLFMIGNWDTQIKRTVAIVGTRTPSPRAVALSSILAETLAGLGWTIVSGLAYGVDIRGQRAALRKGKTVAVLGCGVKNVYPFEHRIDANKITQQGAIMAEVTPESPPSSAQLVARNRIISGLSQAVVMVEGGATSGALYAARFAHQQGRWLGTFDLPSEGNQALLQNEAILIPPTRVGINNFIAYLEDYWQSNEN